jgi:hypothetical protein
MANTYEAIATVTVGSGGAATITFSSIPQTYTDLKVVMSARSLDADTRDSIYIKPNNSTSNLSYRYIRGDGASVTSNTLDRVDINADNATANTFGNLEIYIPNYAGSANKSFSIDTVTEHNATTAYAGLHAWLWADSAAITSLVFSTLATDNFAQYSTATLYGIKNS